MAIEYRRRGISVADYHRMVQTGIVGADEHVELIEGEILTMPPIGPRHRSCVNRLNALFAPLFAARAIVQVQSSVVVAGDSEPEPDVALLRYDAGGYADRDVEPPDIFALVEAGDSSRRFDRLRKLPLYARTNVPEVWLIDLVESTLTVYREPEGERYRVEFVARPGDVVRFAAFPDDALAVDEILRRLRPPNTS